MHVLGRKADEKPGNLSQRYTCLSEYSKWLGERLLHRRTLSVSMYDERLSRFARSRRFGLGCLQRIAEAVLIRRTLLFEERNSTVSGNVYLDDDVVRINTRGADNRACLISMLRSVHSSSETLLRFDWIFKRFVSTYRDQQQQTWYG